jgi:hypothetical protein
MGGDMSGVDSPGGGPPPLPHDPQKAYAVDYKHSVDLFQRSLEECSKAQEMHKKAAFKDVMNRSLQVLNEAASGLKREDLLKQNDQIAKDLKIYEDKEDDSSKSTLAHDLDQAKKSIG